MKTKIDNEEFAGFDWCDEITNEEANEEDMDDFFNF